MRLPLCAAAFFVALLLGNAFAGELLLAPGDRIRVEVFGREDLSAEQQIGPAGTVQLPLIGVVVAGGRTAEELTQVIATALRKGAEVNPSVSVTVESWRPVYVLGDVRDPQAVSYSPDLTALKAIVLAGGFGLPGTEDLTAVDMVKSRQSLGIAQARRAQSLAREARLMAERDGLEEVIYPPALTDGSLSADPAALIDSENRLFEARRADLRGRIESLGRLVETYEAEVTSLEEQRAALEEELKITTDDVAVSDELAAKGLELRSRSSTVQRSRLDVLARLSENAAFRARARANLRETQQNLAEVPIKRTQDVLLELVEVRQALRETASVIMAETRILGESAPEAAEAGLAAQRVRIELTRGGTAWVSAESEQLLPGDVIEVFLFQPTPDPLPETVLAPEPAPAPPLP